MAEIRFPGESAEYRAAREDLTAAEHELSRSVERVAALRRSLPPGGPVPEDYIFTEGPADLSLDGPARPVKLSELFGSFDTLLLYSFMYGPEMAMACPMCTSLLDGLDGSVPDIRQRVGFAVVAKSPIGRIRGYARGRGWARLRLVSAAANSYNRDYHGEDDAGEQQSMMNVFTRSDGEIRHFYASEKRSSISGEDSRHVDLLWPLWNVLDLTREGRLTGGRRMPRDRPGHA